MGANFLLNVGPAGDGSVPPMQKATMGCLGRWMADYGKAIYNGRPYLTYADRRDFILRDVGDPDVAYLFCFAPGQSGDANVTLGDGQTGAVTYGRFDRTVESVVWMDNGEELAFRQQEDRLSVRLTAFPYGKNLCVRIAQIRLKKG